MSNGLRFLKMFDLTLKSMEHENAEIFRHGFCLKIIFLAQTSRRARRARDQPAIGSFRGNSAVQSAVTWLVSPRFSKACAWQPWKAMMILKLYQVREDSVKTSHVRFFQVDQFSALHLLPLFSRHSSIGSVVGTSFFWGWVRNPSWQKTNIFWGGWLGKSPWQDWWSDFDHIWVKAGHFAYGDG